MVCDICGKTMYWCIGHAPYRFEVPATQPGERESDTPDRIE